MGKPRPISTPAPHLPHQYHFFHQVVQILWQGFPCPDLLDVASIFILHGSTRAHILDPYYGPTTGVILVYRLLLSANPVLPSSV